MIETEKFVPTQSRVFAKLKRVKKWNENNKTGKNNRICAWFNLPRAILVLVLITEIY